MRSQVAPAEWGSKERSGGGKACDRSLEPTLTLLSYEPYNPILTYFPSCHPFILFFLFFSNMLSVSPSCCAHHGPHHSCLSQHHTADNLYSSEPMQFDSLLSENEQRAFSDFLNQLATDDMDQQPTGDAQAAFASV